MDCKRVINRLSDLALGALDGPRRAEAEAHIDQCPSCRAALEHERGLAAAIDREVAAHLAVEPSPDFAARVRMRLATVAPGFSPAWRLAPGFSRAWRLLLGGWTRAAAVALAAVMVMGAVWLARRREPCRGAGCSGGVPTAASGTALTAPGTGAMLSADAGVSRSGAEAAVGTPPLQHYVGPAAVRTPPLQPLQREVLPVVIVDQHQQEDIARLYYAIQAKQVDLVSFLAVPPGFKRQADGSLALAPLEIEPAEAPVSDSDSGGAESSPQPLR